MTIDPLDETAAESTPRATPKETERKRIGPYELISKLGEGGMGVVWRAHDPKLDRQVAIKVLKRDDAPQSLRQRLQREARAMARLKHQNVLTVYDSGTEGDRDYIAMELVEGASLDVWLSATPPESEVVEAMLAAGRGLAAAHRAGLVHRDFKPHNVLRSAQGRVMVTDFGLARGLGDDVTTLDEPPRANATATLGLEETVGVSSKSDSVLDVPLTQTGMLIGTPAYMAPEQFEGGAPDPRTDQFAYCVTAWQMLTGGRPFTGGSIAELQLAASEGAANVKTTLPPMIRLALVRGLDPDPKKRWPDMDALLDELERATRPKRPVWVVPVVALVIIGLVVGAFAIARRGRIPASAGRPCEPADAVFGDAWSPALRASLAKQLAARDKPVRDDAFTRIADPFDAYRDRWMQSYDEACRAKPDKLPRARLSCLLAARDNMAAISTVVAVAPAPALEALDVHGLLPNLTICDGPTPVMQPYAPAEKRKPITSLLAQAFTLRAAPDIAAALRPMLDRANEIGWQPVIPMLQLTAGNELLYRFEIEAARSMLLEALAGARASDNVRLQGVARLSLLEASLHQLENVDTPVKPHELPTEIARLLTAARATAKAAGNDPLLIASASLIEAEAWAARARWTHDKEMYAASLVAVDQARKLFAEIGDLDRATHAAYIQATILLARGDDRALDDAMYAARSAADALDQAKLSPYGGLSSIQGTIAFMRGEFAEAAARFAPLARPREPDGETITGVVTNAAGHPASGATVIAWTDELLGDPINLVTDASTLTGERVVSDQDGTFTIHATQASGIVAQWKTERSTPILAGDRKQVAIQTAAPRQAVTGSVVGTWTGELDAFARYDVGDAQWSVRTPVHRDQPFAITGLPDAKAVVGLRAEVGDGDRVVLATSAAAGKPVELPWPSGPPIEVVVRGPLTDRAVVWILPPVDQHFEDEKAIERFAATAQNTALCSPHPIGQTATPGGKGIYAAGDHHCVLAHNSGKVTVCVADDGGSVPGATTLCAPVEVTVPTGTGPSEPAVVLLDMSQISTAPPK